MAEQRLPNRTRKQLLDALRHSEERYRALFEGAPTGIVITDASGRMTSVNAQMERMFGYRREELTGQPVERLVPERFRDAHPGRRAAYGSDPGMRAMGSGRDLTALRKDGSEFPVEIGLSPVRTEEGLLVAAHITDISERKRAEEALREARNELEKRVLERTTELGEANAALQAEINEHRNAESAVSQLSRRLLQLQDEERRRLGRELHDSTAQTLTGVAMNLALVEPSGKRLNAQARKALAESIALTQQCSREIRTISYLLHPPLLDEVGLASAVSWYAGGFSRRSGIPVEVDAAPDLGRLPEDAELTLFRVVQECLTNAHRHSESSAVRIQILRRPTAVTLEVVDSGRGIPAEILSGSSETSRGLGVGIMGMRERMRELGGRLEIESGGWGTSVRAVLPLGGDPS